MDISIADRNRMCKYAVRFHTPPLRPRPIHPGPALSSIYVYVYRKPVPTIVHEGGIDLRVFFSDTMRHKAPHVHVYIGGESVTGDAYYVPPGHTPTLYAGTEIIEFSPTDELRRTIEVVTKNMEAAGT
jgi:hypothetical protein